MVGILSLCTGTTATAGYKDDIGYTRLQAELGTAAPSGAGVTVAHVEYSQPDPNDTEFIGKHFTWATGPDSKSGHATATARYLFGQWTSIAPGVTQVIRYDADGWVFAPTWPSGHSSSVLNYPTPGPAIRGGLLPAANPSRVGSHSYLQTGYSGSLRRLDWYVASEEALQFVGMNNGSGSWSGGLPIAFNHMTVGRSDGRHGSGARTRLSSPDPSEALYLPGPTGPALVVPMSATSASVPVAAAAAVLMIQTGHDDPALSTDPVEQSTTNRAGMLIRNAERAEVIKAALMAGADRTARYTTADGAKMAYMPAYRHSVANQTANGLDAILGAGQLNVYNAYQVIAASEQNSSEDGGPGSKSVGSRGFDYDPAFGGLDGSNAVATYVVPMATTPRLLTATLAWNIAITGGTADAPEIFDGATALHDLDLSLADRTDPGRPATVAVSNSATRNTESLWLVLQPNHRYSLVVERAADSPEFKWDYGLAWQLLADADADGAPDQTDNCPSHANGPMILDAGGHSQLDTDNDGHGNRCDPDLNNDDSVDSLDLDLFKSALFTSDVNADFDGDGLVNTMDLAIFAFLAVLPPGPSGLAPLTGGLAFSKWSLGREAMAAYHDHLRRQRLDEPKRGRASESLDEFMRGR
jgi:hypothetical protein